MTFAGRVVRPVDANSRDRSRNRRRRAAFMQRMAWRAKHATLWYTPEPADPIEFPVFTMKLKDTILKGEATMVLIVVWALALSRLGVFLLTPHYGASAIVIFALIGASILFSAGSSCFICRLCELWIADGDPTKVSSFLGTSFCGK